MYQFVIQHVLHGIPGVRNISDDIIVFGETQDAHDRSLEQTLQRLQTNGLTLNRDKCLFSVPDLIFFGFKISATGLGPDSKKVDAIQDFRAPQNAGEVRSFLGLVNYCARFIRDFATISEPLRQLTRKGVDWSWGNSQQLAFDRLKESLTSDCVMAHYNPEAETELRVDASPVGLGAILMQSNGNETRPVAYASRTLTDVERRYSQTEKEALAVVWSCEKFHLYLYGTEFKLYTDHKPLQFIYSPKGKPPPRIERWVLRLQPYRFKVIHMPGKTNPADVLSRQPLCDQPYRERNIAEEYINFITEKAVPKAMTMEQISRATQDDPLLQQVQQCLFEDRWSDDPDLKKFSIVRRELSTNKGLLLRGTRIVMPKQLRHQTLTLAHESHQGIVRTKQLLRQKVWWPGIDAEIEALIKHCLPCQSVLPPPAPEPLHPSTMPSTPWQSVHIDLCGPFPTGESLLVCVDACSRWPEVEIVRSTTSETIIRRLKRIFATHGFPEQVTSDNGSNLVSKEMEEFFSSHGIRHRKITPYWPQANAMVERFNRTIEKAIRTVYVEGKDWKKELDTFLLNYRATPHAMTGVSPAKIMFGREIRTKIPEFSESEESEVLRDALAHDLKCKTKMQQNADQKNRASSSVVTEGDMVLLKQHKDNKLSTPFDPNAYRVVKRQGTSVLLQRGNEPTLMRNVSWTRKVQDSNQHETDSPDEDDDIDAHPKAQELAPAVDGRPRRACRPPVRMQDFIT